MISTSSIDLPMCNLDLESSLSPSNYRSHLQHLNQKADHTQTQCLDIVLYLVWQDNKVWAEVLEPEVDLV